MGGYRGGEVQRVARYRRCEGAEGARVQKAGGFRRRGEVLEWRERRLNWRWGRVELKRWLLICRRKTFSEQSFIKFFMDLWGGVYFQDKRSY